MRQTSRGTLLFPQLGGQGHQYQVHTKAGEPKFHPSGAPEMSWSFPMVNLDHGANRHIAMSNVIHSIENASPREVAAGKIWYPSVHDAVSKAVSGGFLSNASDPHLSGSGLVAAVSPNMDWEESNIHALDELKRLKPHQWDDIINNRPGAREHVKGLSVSRAPTHALITAGRLIQGEDPEAVMHGPKTYNFMHNIHDPSDPRFLTVDGRAYDVATNRLRPWESGRGIDSFRTKTGKVTRYEHMQNIYTAVANAMGLLPSESQAISWVHMKHGIEQLNETRGSGPTRVGQAYFDPYTGKTPEGFYR
jgi:hypothetical protein